jgi:hypothetical protein
MPVLLVCSVGGSENPIAFRIASAPRPDRVFFVCSADSIAKVPDILALAERLGAPLPVGCHDAWEVGNFEDNGGAKDQLRNAHEDAGDRQRSDSPPVGQRGGAHVVRGQRHTEQIAGQHDNHHQQGRQDGVPGHHQAHRQKEHLHDFFGN